MSIYPYELIISLLTYNLKNHFYTQIVCKIENSAQRWD